MVVLETFIGFRHVIHDLARDTHAFGRQTHELGRDIHPFREYVG